MVSYSMGGLSDERCKWLDTPIGWYWHGTGFRFRRDTGRRRSSVGSLGLGHSLVRLGVRAGLINGLMPSPFGEASAKKCGGVDLMKYSSDKGRLVERRNC